MGEIRNTYWVTTGNPEGKRQLGRPKRRWEDTFKTDFTEIGWGGMGLD
jgi:hypothetical protein